MNDLEVRLAMSPCGRILLELVNDYTDELDQLDLDPYLISVMRRDQVEWAAKRLGMIF